MECNDTPIDKIYLFERKQPERPPIDDTHVGPGTKELEIDGTMMGQFWNGYFRRETFRANVAHKTHVRHLRRKRELFKSNMNFQLAV